MIVYTSNFVDRTIVAILGQAIKVDMKISDAQLGLLGGIAFAVLYTTLGIPIARLAERHNRVTIISICLTSFPTVVSGICAVLGATGAAGRRLIPKMIAARAISAGIISARQDRHHGLAPRAVTD